MKKFKLLSTCLLNVLLASPVAFAREFIDANFEVQLSYSNFDQTTIPAGLIKGTLRRTDDHFACAFTVNQKTYKCQARAAVDQLAWLKIDLTDFGEIVSAAIDPQLPEKTAERIRTILKNHLQSPLLITGDGYAFKNRVQMYDEEISDVLKLTVKIY